MLAQHICGAQHICDVNMVIKEMVLLTYFEEWLKFLSIFFYLCWSITFSQLHDTAFTPI